MKSKWILFGALLAGCQPHTAEMLGQLFDADSGSGAVFEGAYTIDESTRSYRYLEGKGIEERSGAYDLLEGKQTYTRVFVRSGTRTEVVTGIGEMENGTRIYTEIESQDTSSRTTDTVTQESANGVTGFTSSESMGAETFAPSKGINRWDGANDTGLINIESMGGWEILTGYLGRIAVKAAAGVGESWDDAFLSYNPEFADDAEPHVYSVEEVSEGTGTNGDGDEADEIRVKIKFMRGDGTVSKDDVIEKCIQTYLETWDYQRSDGHVEEDDKGEIRRFYVNCPEQIEEAMLTLVDGVITSAEVIYYGVGSSYYEDDYYYYGYGQQVVVAYNPVNDVPGEYANMFSDNTRCEGSSSCAFDDSDERGGTWLAPDPGIGYEYIAKCDDDGDKTEMYLDDSTNPSVLKPRNWRNPTPDVTCRFISQYDSGDVYLGGDNYEILPSSTSDFLGSSDGYGDRSPMVDFEELRGQLKKYISFSVYEGKMTYKLNKWTNPE